MISICPRCGRTVANDETVVKTDIGWVPTACIHENEPPLCGQKVTNHLHFYVSVVRDNGKQRLLLGPYPTWDEANENVRKGKEKAKVDPRAPWYAYGTCSSNEVFKTIFGK